MAVVVTARRDDEIALPEARQPYDMRRHPGISRIGEITVAGTTNEPAVTRGIEPSHGFTVGNDRSRRRLWLVHWAPAATAMATMTTSVAIMLEVALSLLAIEALPTAMLLVAVIRRRRW
jgi:hypothetical protein